MKTVAIIPARAGSKNIINKNIYPINGKPLIGYCLEALKNSLVDHYYVSTDSSEIATISKNFGASIIDRPKEISEDQSPTIDCIKHAIDTLNLSSETVLLTIQATTPLIIPSDINEAIYKIKNQHNDYVISVTENHSSLWYKNKDDSLIPKDHDPKNRICRQLMPKIYSETGSIYATKVKHIINNNSLIGVDKVGFIEIPKIRSFEIDDYEDILIIESILKNNNI